MEGRVPFGKKKYHHPEYETLIKTVVPLRHSFRLTHDASARKEIANEEFGAWTKYLEVRKEEIRSEEWGVGFTIDSKTKSLLRDQFDRLKNRDTLKVKSAKIVDFHSEFGKKFRFRVPIHPRNLSQLTHPY